MSGYYFFLSYARLDRATEKPSAIERFYKDLTAEIRFQTAEEPETIGFGTEAEAEYGFLDMDVIKPGEQWPGAVEGALRTCRAFVPILSPTYLTRPRCGKEWAVFRNRVRAEVLPDAKLHPLIQPVLLGPPKRIKTQPKLVSDIQQASGTYPELYTANGLRALIGKTAQYKAFVRAFAEVLIEAVEGHPVPPGEQVPPLDEITSVFEGDEAEEQSKGPQSAAFMFVAGRRDEIGTIRERLDNYGDTGGSDWQPYLPDATELVSQIAIEVAADENFAKGPFLTADDHALTRLIEEVRAEKIVAVLADAWTLRLRPYQEQMKRLDATNYLNCVVVVVWNDRDDETVGARAELEKALRDAFPANYVIRPPEKFIEVSSAQDLRERLGIALTKARMRMLNEVEEPKKAQAAPTTRAPMSLPGISSHGGVAA